MFTTIGVCQSKNQRDMNSIYYYYFIILIIIIIYTL